MSGVTGQGKGNRNAALPESEGKRLKLDLSLSRERRAFFEHMVGIGATDQEIIDTARAWCYEQMNAARER